GRGGTSGQTAPPHAAASARPSRRAACRQGQAPAGGLDQGGGRRGVKPGSCAAVVKPCLKGQGRALVRPGPAGRGRDAQLSRISSPSTAMPWRMRSSDTVTKLRRRVLVLGLSA